MRVKDGEAEMEAVDVAHDRHSELVTQYNALVTEQQDLSRRLEKLSVDMDAQTQQLAATVIKAAESQYAAVREYVEDLYKAMLKHHPDVMAEQKTDPTSEFTEEEITAVETPPQRRHSARRPDGTTVRRPSRPKRPKETS